MYKSIMSAIDVKVVMLSMSSALTDISKDVIVRMPVSDFQHMCKRDVAYQRQLESSRRHCAIKNGKAIQNPKVKPMRYEVTDVVKGKEWDK